MSSWAFDNPDDIKQEIKSEIDDEEDELSLPSCSKDDFLDIKPQLLKNPARCHPESCAVCGRPASGHHYEAPSCNGCKTYFRRVLVAGRILECPLGGRCASKTKRSGRLCRACRFDECIKTGMDPRAVQLKDRDSNPLWRKLVKDLKLAEDESSSSDESLVLSPRKSALELDISELISRLTRIEITMQQIRRGDMFPDPEVTTYATLLEPRPSITQRTMTVKEISCGPDVFLFIELVAVTAYLRNLPFVDKLHHTDKIAWARDVGIAVKNAMHGYESTENKSDSVLLPTGQSVPMRDIATRDEHNLLFKKPVSFFREHLFDLNEYVLLKAIVACSYVYLLSDEATREINAEKQRLVRALFHYEIVTHGEVIGVRRMQDALGVVSALVKNAADHKDVFLLRAAGSAHIKFKQLISDAMLPFGMPH